MALLTATALPSGIFIESAYVRIISSTITRDLIDGGDFMTHVTVQIFASPAARQALLPVVETRSFLVPGAVGDLSALYTHLKTHIFDGAQDA
jgi:hypothetical protein